MTGPAVLQLLGSAAFAAILVAIINAVVTRRKLGAEATKIITDAASGVIANIEKDNERLRRSEATKAKQINALAKRIDALEERRDEDVATIADQRTEITGLQRQMAAVIDDRDAIVAYVIVFHAWVANGSRPPAPTVPRHLADVIPAWVAGDGAEPPRVHPPKETT